MSEFKNPGSGRTSCAAALVCLLAALTIGCGNQGGTYRVRGHVQSPDGTRANFGSVELTSVPDGHTARGLIQPDGSFELGTFDVADGAVPGKHRAVVVQMVNTEGAPLSEHDHPLDVHPRYGRYESSGLEFTIEPHHRNYLEIVVDPAR